MAGELTRRSMLAAGLGAAGALTTLSAAVAGDWGDRDLAELPRYVREFLPQTWD